MGKKKSTEYRGRERDEERKREREREREEGKVKFVGLQELEGINE